MKNIAILGLGAHALKTAIPALNNSDLINVIGVCTRDSAKGKKFAQHNGLKYWHNEEILFADPSVDVIYVATPIGVHYRQVKKALESGKHVFCEKALVESHQDAQELFSIARDKNLMLAECYMYLYHNQFFKLNELLVNNVIGDIKSVHARFGYPHLDSDNIRYNYQLGGGALLDAGVYPLSLLSMMSNNNVCRFTGHLDFRAEYDVDVGGAFFAVAKGKYIVGEWGMGRDYANDVVIWGSKGQLHVERSFSKRRDLTTRLIVKKNGSEEILKIESDDHFKAMFDHFVDALDNIERRKELRERSLFVASLISKLKSGK